MKGLQTCVRKRTQSAEAAAAESADLNKSILKALCEGCFFVVLDGMLHDWEG